MTSEQGWQAGAATGVLSDPCKSQVSCSVPRGVRCCEPLQKELGFAGQKQEKITQCGVRFWKDGLSRGCSCNSSARLGRRPGGYGSARRASSAGRACGLVGLIRGRLLGCGGPDCRFGGQDEARSPASSTQRGQGPRGSSVKLTARWRIKFGVALPQQRACKGASAATGYLRCQMARQGPHRQSQTRRAAGVRAG